MTSPDFAQGAPRPGPHLSSAPALPSPVSPEKVASAIGEMLDELDELGRHVADGDDGSPLSLAQLGVLDRQADLLERAHRVLADALSAIDHA